MTAHSTQPNLIDGYRPLVDKLQVPGSASALLEYRLGQEDRAAVGFAVHVPHYLAQAAYPAAAVTLLESVQRAADLVLPGDTLREAAHRTDLEIARQVEDSAEVTEVVQALEQQYDAFTAGRENLLGSDGEPMPTAEELGAEFERFLAEQQGRGDFPDAAQGRCPARCSSQGSTGCRRLDASSPRSAGRWPRRTRSPGWRRCAARTGWP